MSWLKLGTRGSPLALAQARQCAALLAAAHGRDEGEVAIVIVKTTGDKVQDRPLAEIGGKALWTKELDAALLDRRIDFAVHSLKDVETGIPQGIVLAAVLERADVREVLIGAARLTELAKGARLGTSSPRRAAQALALRRDLQIVPFRGNVETRLQRIGRGEADATLLAAAGLMRLGLTGIGSVQAVSDFLPAPSQGAIGITARADDEATRAILSAIDHPPSRAAVLAERTLLAALGASCHSCVGAHATLGGGTIGLKAELLTPGGEERVTAEAEFQESETDAAVGALAANLLARASPALRATFDRA